MSAMSSAVSRSASAKTMLGFLPPSSRATFFTVPDATAMIRLPVSEPAGERDQVDARVLAERGSGVRAVAEDEVADARGQPGLVEQPHQVDGGVRARARWA